MRTFHYFPPAPEEQRGFVIQLGGCLLGLIAIGVLALRTTDAALRGVMIGMALGVLTVLARSVVQLETKAQRAQNASIGVDEDGLHLVDRKGRVQTILWEQVEKTEVTGGRLQVNGPGGELKIGSREVENGMELMGLIAARGKSTPEPNISSNFIPLSPK